MIAIFLISFPLEMQSRIFFRPQRPPMRTFVHINPCKKKKKSIYFTLQTICDHQTFQLIPLVIIQNDSQSKGSIYGAEGKWGQQTQYATNLLLGECQTISQYLAVNTFLITGYFKRKLSGEIKCPLASC